MSCYSSTWEAIHPSFCPLWYLEPTFLYLGVKISWVVVTDSLQHLWGCTNPSTASRNITVKDALCEPPTFHKTQWHCVAGSQVLPPPWLAENNYLGTRNHQKEKPECPLAWNKFKSTLSTFSIIKSKIIGPNTIKSTTTWRSLWIAPVPMCYT